MPPPSKRQRANRANSLKARAEALGAVSQDATSWGRDLCKSEALRQRQAELATFRYCAVQAMAPPPVLEDVDAGEHGSTCGAYPSATSFAVLPANSRLLWGGVGLARTAAVPEAVVSAEEAAFLRDYIVTAIRLRPEQKLLSGTGGKFKGQSIQGGSGVAIGSRQMRAGTGTSSTFSPSCHHGKPLASPSPTSPTRVRLTLASGTVVEHYVCRSEASSTVPNRLALHQLRDQRAARIMARQLKWLAPEVYATYEEATKGLPRLDDSSPVVALWATQNWERATHQDKLDGPIIAVWMDLPGDAPTGGEFCWPSTATSMPAPQPGRLQAVLWDGSEEHATCLFSSNGTRRLSLAVMHRCATTLPFPPRPRRWLVP